MTVEPLPTPPHLFVVDGETGERHGDCPGCEQRDEMIERLQADVENLEAEGRRYRRKISDLTRERHKDLHLHPRAETVRRVYARWRATCKPRAQEKIPDDRMQMGLERTKNFSEEQMLTAVRGAASGLAVDRKTGHVWNDWENVFRNTKNVFIYIEHAERWDEQRRRQMPLGMEMLGLLRYADLYDAERSTDLHVRGRCPVCKRPNFRLDVRSGSTLCEDDCDILDIDAAFTSLRATWGQAAA